LKGKHKKIEKEKKMRKTKERRRFQNWETPVHSTELKSSLLDSSKKETNGMKEKRINMHLVICEDDWIKEG
jgi:hypothetical protein